MVGGWSADGRRMVGKPRGVDNKIRAILTGELLWILSESGYFEERPKFCCEPTPTPDGHVPGTCATSACLQRSQRFVEARVASRAKRSSSARALRPMREPLCTPLRVARVRKNEKRHDSIQSPRPAWKGHARSPPGRRDRCRQHHRGHRRGAWRRVGSEAGSHHRGRLLPTRNAAEPGRRAVHTRLHGHQLHLLPLGLRR